MPPNAQVGREQDVYDMSSSVSPMLSRSASAAGSDRFSTVSAVTAYWQQNPNDVYPAPAYVAELGAAQVVSEGRGNGARSREDTSDDEATEEIKDDVQFTEAALKLVNSFLDQILFSALSTARSTNLHALRPAVTEVLKARLAKEAIASADEELKELLAGGEEGEEKSAARKAREASSTWDLELVWKRTRLRVMVYMRLGEMEDEDEERYVKEQELFYGKETERRRFSATSGLVSWASAIFLTSILEYIAEQTLQIAGAAAYARARRRSRTQQPVVPTASAQTPDRVLVEDYDVERAALDPRLGRIWRTWRKTLRNATARTSTPSRAMSSRRSMSRDGGAATLVDRRDSVDTVAGGSVYGGERGQNALTTTFSHAEVPEATYTEDIMASNIPLPMQDAKRDVDEIEVPGLARDPDEEVDETEAPAEPITARRSSFTNYQPHYTVGDLPTPAASDAQSPVDRPQRPLLLRKRSTSVPTPMRTPLRTPMFEIPGEFPIFPEESATEPVALDAEPESATERDLPAAGEDDDADVSLLDTRSKPDAPEEETSAEESSAEQHGLIGAAVASVSAIAGAAAATLYGAQKDNDAERSSSERASSVIDRPVASESSKKPRDIEDLDSTKSLASLKRPVANNGDHVADRVQHDTASGRAVKQAMESAVPQSSSSNATFSLGEYGIDQALKLPEPEMANQSMHFRGSSKEVVPTDDLAALGAVVSEEQSRAALSRSTSSTAPHAAELVGSPVRSKTRELPSYMSANAVASRPSQETPSTPLIPKRPELKTADRSSRDFLESRNLSATKSDAEALAENQRHLAAGVAAGAAAEPVAAYGRTKSDRTQSPGYSQAYGGRRPMSEPERASDGRPDLSAPTTASPNKITKDEVLEHPVVQQMSSPKSKRPANINTGLAAEPQAVISARIRNPGDFDQFVQSEETIKYTLTPGQVRGEQTAQLPPAEIRAATSQRDSGPLPLAPPAVSPRQSSFAHKSQQSAAVPKAVQDARDSRAGRSQSSKHATAARSQDNTSTASAEEKKERRRSTSRPSPRNTSAHRRSGLMAREPQVVTDSTRDFADWIRSTGPDKEPEIYPLNTSRSIASLHSIASTNGRERSQSIGSSVNGVGSNNERTKSLSKKDIVQANIPPVPPVPNGRPARSALQARNAKGASTDNADLINFIRDGPSSPEQHRIPRSVAPFRNTMDSDQFNDIGHGSSMGSAAPLRLNTNFDTESSIGANSTGRSPSTRTHTSTQRADGSAPTPVRMHPAHSGQPQRLNPAEPPSVDNKKRYRNKDPYAMFDLDSDDEDVTALPQSRRPEESLADFLRNNEPPANNDPKPLVSARDLQSANAARINSVSSPHPSTRSGPRMEARTAGAKEQRADTGDLASFLRTSAPPAAPMPREASRSKMEFDDENAKPKKRRGLFGFGRKRSEKKEVKKGERTWGDMP